MPEGDAVRRTARALDEALAGRRLLRADLRVPRHATTDLSGMTVDRTAVAGKHLLTRLLGRAGRITLHTHLRMDGRWVTGPAGPRPIAGPQWQIRAWLATEETQAVGVRLAMVEVLSSAREHRIVGHLGPDILGPDLDAGAAALRVRAEEDRPLAEALLDQRVISGLGTIWTAETAFNAGVSPWTAAGAAGELAEALARTRTAMQTSLGARRRADRPKMWVYGNLGQPCRRCGTPIRMGRVGAPPTDRVAFWCPQCQPGPQG
jgi:endonuclease-8